MIRHGADARATQRATTAPTTIRQLVRNAFAWARTTFNAPVREHQVLGDGRVGMLVDGVGLVVYPDDT